MLRISRLTDYGIVLLATFAERAPGETCNARELAETTRLPFPMVGKVLKSLAQAALLVSHRGAKGGYALARPPEAITVAEIIEALEGPIALVECSAGPGQCGQESSCHVRDPWQVIHSTIRSTLAHVTLDRLVRPQGDALLQLERPLREAEPSGAGARGSHV
jgi:FeS assembly SUF system regulator